MPTEELPRDRDELRDYSQALVAQASADASDVITGAKQRRSSLEELMAAALTEWALRRGALAVNPVREALRVMRELEVQGAPGNRTSVEKKKLWSTLAERFANTTGAAKAAAEAEAERTIRTLFREGLIYESKPGWVRRLGS